MKKYSSDVDILSQQTYMAYPEFNPSNEVKSFLNCVFAQK